MENALTDLSKHKHFIFCNDQTASRGINSDRFRQLDPITETVYQLTLIPTNFITTF